MTINREHLAPCPFCGGPAEAHECIDGQWFASCIANDCNGQIGYANSLEECAKRWNTRAQAAPEAEPVAIVREEKGEGFDVECVEFFSRVEPGTKLYTAPQHDAELATATADDIRRACQDAIEVFADEPGAAQCREVAEYMREVLLARINAKLATLRHV